jgi:hypothetical protein
VPLIVAPCLCRKTADKAAVHFAFVLAVCPCTKRSDLNCILTANKQRLNAMGQFLFFFGSQNTFSLGLGLLMQDYAALIHKQEQQLSIIPRSRQQRQPYKTSFDEGRTDRIPQSLGGA